MKYHYVWLLWASAFLVPWLILFVRFPEHRKLMWYASLGTMPFGLTEPLFVPEYWNPPSLFELARRTGFDIESLIFCFAIGGVGSVLYNAITRQGFEPISWQDRSYSRHRFHWVALLVPVITFSPLYFLPWNPIYPGIAALIAGAIATVLCRPDLKHKTLLGGVLFLGYYALFMFLLKWSAPGYIEQVWNLGALTGINLFGIPLEELLFGSAFGMYWAGVYEHLLWRRSTSTDKELHLVLKGTTR